VIGHVDHVGRVYHLNGQVLGATMPGKLSADLIFDAHEDDGRASLLRFRNGAGHHHGRRVVSSHGIYSDFHATRYSTRL
jgi:hypothetical protein